MFAVVIIAVLVGTLIPLVDAQVGLYAPRVEYDSQQARIKPYETMTGQ
jgi:hypothetical protein